MSWATAASIGLDLASGLFGKKSKGPDPIVQFDEMQSLANRHSLDYTTKYPSAAAKGFQDAGIHPIYGFGGGAAMGSMPGVQVGSLGEREAGSRFQALGQGLSRAAQAWASREEREIAKVSAALQVENQRLQNDRLRSEINLMNQPGSSPGFTERTAIPGQGDARYKLQHEMPLGVGDQKPLSISAVDEKGRSTRVLNPDLGDNEWLMLAHALGFSLPDWIKNRGRDMGQIISRRWSKEERQRMKTKDYWLFKD